MSLINDTQARHVTGWDGECMRSESLTTKCLAPPVGVPGVGVGVWEVSRCMPTCCMNVTLD